MNEDLLQMIDKATAAHALWKVRLLDAIEGKGQKLDRQFAADCHACEFGKWLDGNQAELSLHPEYSGIYARHQAFHQEVGIILDKLMSGQIQEAGRSLQEGGVFRQNSSRLVLDLLRWRDRLAG